MRRVELVNAVKALTQALEASKLKEVTLEIMKHGEAKDSKSPILPNLFKALKEYSISAANFDSATKKLIRIMGLNYLEDPTFWARMASAAGRQSLLPRLYRDVEFTIDYFTKIIPLIKQESLRELNEADEGMNIKFKGKDLLSVLVIEEHSQFSSPARLIQVLESVSFLYESCAMMMQLPPEGLGVIACDSGSDKSFDFLGAAKVIECVKEVILSLWDRIVFFREKQLAQRIELITQALPIIERISELEQENKIGPEQAEILRRKILSGVSGFIESGAVIPEIEERTHFNPRLLMAAEPKLLTEGEGDNDIEEVNHDQDLQPEQTITDMSAAFEINTLTEEEQAELLRLLRKTNKADKSHLSQPGAHNDDVDDSSDPAT